jgi:hypothetical protein
MAGSAKSVNTDIAFLENLFSYMNSNSTGSNTTNITTSKDSIKQYVKTKNGIFNGAFGSVAQTLTISSGVLDLTKNSTGAVVVRRAVYVLPESSTTDTLDSIELNGLELPNQELILMSSTGNTITIAHNASASGTRKTIYCPGDTSYVLAPNEAVKLIYDPVNTIWIVTGSSSSATVVDNSITFAKIQDIATMKVIGRTASGSGDSSEISILDEDTMSSNSATAVATQQSIKAYVDANGGSTSFVGFTADDDLSMGTYNIDGVDQLIFSSATSSDSPTWTTTDYGFEIAGGTTPTALDIRVPTGKFVNVKVAGTTEFAFKSNELDCIDNDICNVGTVFTDYISMSSGNDNVRIWGHLNPISDDTYDLGTSSLKWKDLHLSNDLVFDTGYNVSKLFFDGGGDTYITGSNLTGTINILNDNSLNTSFGTSGITTIGIEINGALNHDGTTVGFYGTTPITKQTSVAVSSAGIHQALVNLGLIS